MQESPKHVFSCWNGCISRWRYLQAQCSSREKAANEIVLSQTHYIISEYIYNQKRYKIPIKIDKNNIMTFSKAIGSKDCLIQEDISSLISEWLGPNEDFHGTIVTPRLLGYKQIQLFHLDVETFETVNRFFQEDEPMSLKVLIQVDVQTEEPPHTEFLIESPRFIDDPREPREPESSKQKYINATELKELHYI